MVVPLDSVSSFFIPTTENGFVGADFANDGKYGPSTPLFGPGGQTYNPIADETLLEERRWLRSSISPWVIFEFDAANPGSFTVSEATLDAKGTYTTVQDPNSDNVTVVVNGGGYVHPYDGSYEREADNYALFKYPTLVTMGRRRLADDNGLAFPGFWRDSSLYGTEQYDFINNLIDGNNKLEQQEFDVFEANWRNTFFNDRMDYQLSYFPQELKFRQDSNLGNIYAPEIGVIGHSTNPLSGDFQSRNWSVKVDPMKLFFDLTRMDDNWFPFRLAFLYSEGEVQNPQPGRRDIMLNDLAPATGHTADRSLAISTKDGRFSLRVTKFDTVQQNANAGSVAASDNWRIEQILNDWGGLAQVRAIERGDAIYAQGVFDNGDDVDDPNE